jgi:ribosomal protein S18 acetylase RimI-like enzyme
MIESLVIRELLKTDNIDQLVILSKAFFYEYETYHDFFFRIDTLGEEDISNYFSSWIGADNKRAFIAVLQERIVGYITVYISEQANFWEIKKVGDISGFMVDKTMRRQGIGQELLESAMKFLKGKDIKHYTLFTSCNNDSALAFYKSYGMTPLYSHLLGDVEATMMKLEQ